MAKNIEILTAGEHYDVLHFCRGHVDFTVFCEALKAEGYLVEREPRHSYARIVPDATGEYRSIFLECKQGRGAFPITII